jgi:hypothetical protein
VGLELNKTIRLACAASIGLGAFIAIGILVGEQSPHVVTAISPSAVSDETTPPDARPQTQSEIALPSPTDSVPPPAIDTPLRWDFKKSAVFHLEATRYTQTFQPGIVMDDSLPQFVALYEDSVSQAAITALFHDHKQLPSDGWSAAMEHRLARYFEAQSETSMTRVSVNCRLSRCLLQFIELPPVERSASNAMAMLLRLKQEPWYAEEFLDSGSFRPLRVPTRGDAVQYMVLILNGRPIVR